MSLRRSCVSRKRLSAPRPRTHYFSICMETKLFAVYMALSLLFDGKANLSGKKLVVFPCCYHNKGILNIAFFFVIPSSDANCARNDLKKNSFESQMRFIHSAFVFGCISFLIQFLTWYEYVWIRIKPIKMWPINSCFLKNLVRNDNTIVKLIKLLKRIPRYHLLGDRAHRRLLTEFPRWWSEVRSPNRPLVFGLEVKELIIFRFWD